MEECVGRMEAGAPKRYVYLDILRVIAMLAVVLLHVSAPGWQSLSTSSGAWAAHTVYTCFSRFGVPLFFMISGALLLEPGYAFSFKKLLGRNVLRLVSAYIFWSVVYVCISGYFSVPRSSLAMLAGFVMQIIGGAYHLWFIPALIGLYLLLPFLRKIAADRRTLAYFLLLWLLFGLCLDTARTLGVLGETVLELMEETKLHFVLGYTGLFMLGYYLKSGDFSRPVRILLIVGGLAGYIATVLLTLLFARGGTANDFWLQAVRPNVALMAAGVFMGGKCLWGGRQFSIRSARVFAALGKWSFGAYLSHVAVLWLLQNVLGLSVLDGSWLMIPLVTLATAALSYALSAALNRIPFVKRWLV